MNDAVWLRAPGSAPPRGSREAQGRGTLQLTCPGTAPRLTRLQASTGRGRPPTAPALSLQNAPPPPRWALTAQKKSPWDQGSPAPWGLGTAATPSRCVPQPHTLDCPASSTILASTSSRKTPPCCQGWARPGRGPQQQRVSPEGASGVGGPQPQVHMSEDGGVALTAGRRGGACKPSNRRGGSSQEAEAARKKAAPHGKHLPARPQEDPRKHKACSRIFT